MPLCYSYNDLRLLSQEQFLCIVHVSSCSLYIMHMFLPYFFGYKTELFFIQNNSNNLDLSYKMDLDFLDCLGRVKLVL